MHDPTQKMFLHISRMDCMCERASRPSAWLYISAALYHRQGEDATLLLLTCFPVNFFCVLPNNRVLLTHTHTHKLRAHTHININLAQPPTSTLLTRQKVREAEWKQARAHRCAHFSFLAPLHVPDLSITHTEGGCGWIEEKKIWFWSFLLKNLSQFPSARVGPSLFDKLALFSFALSRSHFFSLPLYNPTCPLPKVWIWLKPYVLCWPWDIASISMLYNY